tara:strand:+ start:1563 stop:1781 length:219 start_codon:yes stop_codon:yes gene_type:complete
MKILISTFLISIFYNSLSLSNEIEDCSAYSKLSPKFLKCKTGNFITDTKNYQKKEWSEEKKKVNKLKKGILN